MDFASGLANLEQTAANAQNNRRRPRDNNHNNNSNNDDDHRRHQPRPRRDDHRNTQNNYRGGGRGHHHNNHHSNNGGDQGLEGLVRYGYRLPRGPYHRPPPIAANNSRRPLHICLLAITIDELPYEAIWRAWATAISSSSKLKVSLVCHAKHPDKVESEWLKQRMLLQPRRIVRGNSLSDPEFLSHKPGWGSVEITRAMIDLLVQGMAMGRKGDASKEGDARFSANRFWITPEDKTMDELAKEDVPPADKFIFISETCMPVTTLEECGKALFAVTTRAATPTTTTNVAAAVAAKDSKQEESKENPKEEESKAQPAKEKDAADTKPQPSGDSNSNKAEDSAAAAAANSSYDNDKVIYLDTSWVNARNFNSPNTPQNKYERDQFSQIHKVVPKRYRWKADQWMVVSRTHAAALLDLDHSSNLSSKDHLWNSFRRINASDEMYFPTTLALAGVLLDNTKRLQWQPPANANANANPATEEASQQQQEAAPLSPAEDRTPWLKRRKVTYTDWSMGARNPASFTTGIKDFIKVARLAREQKCLFARKFSPFDSATEKRTGDISVEDWKRELEAMVGQAEEAA